MSCRGGEIELAFSIICSNHDAARRSHAAGADGRADATNRCRLAAGRGRHPVPGSPAFAAGSATPYGAKIVPWCSTSLNSTSRSMATISVRVLSGAPALQCSSRRCLPHGPDAHCLLPQHANLMVLHRKDEALSSHLQRPEELPVAHLRFDVRQDVTIVEQVDWTMVSTRLWYQLADGAPFTGPFRPRRW